MRLGVPELVEVREALRGVHQLPQRDRIVAFGSGDDHGPVDGVPARLEHDRRHAVGAVGGGRVVVVAAHVFDGRVVVDRALDEGRDRSRAWR